MNTILAVSILMLGLSGSSFASQLADETDQSILGVIKGCKCNISKLFEKLIPSLDE